VGLVHHLQPILAVSAHVRSTWVWWGLFLDKSARAFFLRYQSLPPMQGISILSLARQSAGSSNFATAWHSLPRPSRFDAAANSPSATFTFDEQRLRATSRTPQPARPQAVTPDAPDSAIQPAGHWPCGTPPPGAETFMHGVRHPTAARRRRSPPGAPFSSSRTNLIYSVETFRRSPLGVRCSLQAFLRRCLRLSACFSYHLRDLLLDYP